MKKFTLYLILFLFISASQSFAQFDKPFIQFGIGLVSPFGDLKGNQYTITTPFPQNPTFQTTRVDTALWASHYGAKTGFSIFGSGKINFDKYNIFRAVGTVSYNTFNSFEGSVSGNQVRVYYPNYVAVPITYNYSFTDLGIGLGLEIAPTAFTNVVSPFIGANISFNNFNSTVTRNTTYTDSVSASVSGFRIGATLNAGIEAKFTPQFGGVIGIKYDLGNLLLRTTANSNYGDVIQWGAANGNLNDEQGSYYSNVSNDQSDANYYQYYSKKKDINWGTIYIGLNYYINTTTSKKK
ncbi:hypothetical protein BH10BAC5_BH10BAC5_00610 [soil metagenome]